MIRSIAGKKDVYGVFLDSAADWGYGVLPFAYDWRADIAVTSAHLARRMRECEGAEFRIVAHSMGGLVVRAMLILNPDLAARVRLFLQVGTPSRGSASAYRTLQQGDIFGPAELLRDLLLRAWPAGKDRWFEYRDSLLSMTAIFQLLPPSDVQILKTKHHGWLCATDRKAWPQSRWDMLRAAGRLRLLLESFDFPRMQTIVESSIDTDDSYAVDAYYRPIRSLSRQPGDGRVTVQSSEFGTPEPRRKSFAREIAHDNLLSDIEVLDHIRRELKTFLPLPLRLSPDRDLSPFRR